MKKGINIWSFDQNLPLTECMKLAKMAGFEGIELALSEDGPLSLKSTDKDILEIKKAAEDIGISIASLATGLYWRWSLTSNYEHIRIKAQNVAKREIEIANLLGVDVVMVCPGSVGVDFRPEEVVPDAGKIDFFAGSEIIDYDVCWKRSISALKELAKYAEEYGVRIGVENIWNKFLLSPIEMNYFIDEIGSPNVGVWFDVANVLMFGYPEQWIRIINKKIIMVHFKDFRCAVKSLNGFVDLLAGDVNWKDVKAALDGISYTGWCDAEMCPTYKLYTNQMIYNCSAAMDCILERI